MPLSDFPLPTGWYIYSLRERPPSSPYPPAHWEVSLRHESCLIAYGQGPTLEAALTMAISKIPDAEPHNPSPATLSPTYSNILSRLGLASTSIPRKI